jgi:SAM-dependent methyltransferase
MSVIRVHPRMPCGEFELSESDRSRWETKYTAGNPNPGFVPDPLLVQHKRLLDGKGWALDVACGVGQNAIYLAQRGYEVVAVDGSLAGLRHCRAALAGSSLRVHLVAADLDRFVLPRDKFALVVVFRFLDRQLIPKLKEVVVPGGLIIYQTFNVNRLRATPQMTRSYLLELSELASMFADFETIETNDTPDNRAELSHWIGRRP